MAKLKIRLSDVFKKHVKIVGYLLVSGIAGYFLGVISEKPELVVVFAPAINYVLYAIEKELKSEGYIKAIRG